MPVRSPLRAAVVASRRTALGCGILALTTVSGCDGTLTGEPVDGPSDARPQATAGTPGDPDTVLVEEVLAELSAMVGLVTQAATDSSRLRVPLTALRDLHLAHAAALVPDPDGSTPTSTPAPSPAAPAEPPGDDFGSTRSRVVTGERRLQRRLADWAVAAESGALARLLASMSAAVAQHVVHHLGASPDPGTGSEPDGGEAG